MRFKTFVLCTSSALVLAVAPAWAQDTGTEQAQAQPVGTEAETLPADAAAEEEQTIVVTGLRRSLQSAQNIKRNSDQIVDAIVAEDIGKLPDITASASLARITGVQVTRAAGEAADVQVRGLPDLSTTYNSREIFTAENRSVALQDFPAGGVAALEVYKSSTANLIEGGVAGQINVRSRRPFDFSGFEAFGAVSGVLFEESQDVVPNANLLLSNRWDTGIGEIGILLNAAVAKTNFLDSNREQADFIERARPEQTATPGFRFPDTQAIFFGQGNRTRPSVNGAIQWRPSANLEITIDGLFQGYRGRDFNQFRRFNLFGGGIRFTDVVLQEDGVSAESLTVTNPAAPFGFAEFRNVNTDTYQIGGNVAWRGENLRVSGDLAYTDSTFEEDQTNVDSILLGLQTFRAVFESDAPSGGPTFDIGNYNINDPNNYNFEGLFERRRLAKGNDIQARLDAEYDLDLGFISRIQAGLRFSDREASRLDGGRFTFIGFRGVRFSDPSIPVEFRQTDPGFSFDDVMRVRSLVSPDRKSLWGNIEDLRGFVGAPLTPPDYEPQNSFDANEKSYSAYGQVKYAFDAGFPIDGLVGLRVVKTETDIAGTQRVFGQTTTFVPVASSQEYTDYLPNVSVRMEFMPELQLRAAYTETRTRPRFDQLNPSANIDPPPSCATNNDPSDDANCFRTGNSGNPNLRRLMSENYDLSLEYYFARAGSATLALFRRDVNGFIADASVEFDDPTFGRLRFVAPDNGGDGRLQGVELGFTSFLDFDWVPVWARGFGLQANYTYIDNGAELPPRLIAGLPDTPGLFPGKPRIEDVSKHSYNLVGLYENEKFSARLAYNYRSQFTDFYQRFFDPAAGRDRIAPVIQEGRGVLDFATSITPIENVTFAFDATNLLGNPIKTFREYDGNGSFFSRQRRYLERTYALTLRVRY